MAPGRPWAPSSLHSLLTAKPTRAALGACSLGQSTWRWGAHFVEAGAAGNEERKSTVKLAILGGGGVRMPAFVKAVVANSPDLFGEIRLFEPDAVRRGTTGRLAVEVAAALGYDGLVSLSADPEEAFSGVDFVFSAIRVGGDQGRVIDEQVALRKGLVGQETTGPGGAAMALRTIPVVLSYCELLARCAPKATLVNFTNPAGIVTQAISAHGAVQAVGVCDTPSGTLARLGAFLGADPEDVSFNYAGLNHLGWVSSFRAGGEERIEELLRRFDELQHFDHCFTAFDPAMVRRTGAIPTEYVYYYYDPARYVSSVARAGSTRGQDVLRLNEELLKALTDAFDKGGVHEAWAAYSSVLGVRHETYMRTDTEGDNHQGSAREHLHGAEPLVPAAKAGDDRAAGGAAGVGGYEGVALQVIAGLSAARPAEVIVNVRNGSAVNFLGVDDVVEVPALVNGGGLQPLAVGELPLAARGLVSQVKEYERTLVEAAITGDAGLAEVALAMHPLVPGASAARELLAEYRQLHGPHLAYLH